MKVDEHISELLYDHDCVIVPSFGGFLASYAHARIHPTQHTFSSPSKKIAFNVFLKQNDGLLANHMVHREKLSYADALNQIERHVNRWQQELADGKKLIIDRIGTFYFDSEKNLQFDSAKNVNYLRDAFGLGPVQYLPVKRENDREKVEKQLKEMVAIRPSEKPERLPLKISKKTKRKILGTLILSSALLWLSWHLYLVAPHYPDLSTLNPFSSGSNTETKKVEAPVMKEPITISNAAVETVYVANSTPVNPSITTPPAPKEESRTVEKTSESSVSAVPVPQQDQKYFVIGGAFEFLENAEAFVKTLQSQGFTDARILDTTRHLKMVCFKGFATHSEALKASENLKEQNKGVWIYKW